MARRPPPPNLDWGQTGTAKANRTAKIETLAKWCWHHGITAAIVRQQWDQPTRNACARAAGVNPPGRTSPTWANVAAQLARWDGTRAEERLHEAEHARWCASCDRADLHAPGSAPATPRTEPLPVPPGPPTNVGGCPGTSNPDGTGLEVPVPRGHAPAESAAPSDLPVAATLVDQQQVVPPRGWLELAASGPVDPPQPCGLCGAPAIVRSLASHGSDLWRCAAHPPVPGDWGYGLWWGPRPCLLPLECRCGRHEVSCRAVIQSSTDTTQGIDTC